MDGKAKLEELAAKLDAHPDYRVLRRLDPPERYAEEPRGQTHRALFVDCETTGLDTDTAAVIELAMVPFVHDAEARIVAVCKKETFVELADPGIAIPPEVIALTGITDEMVKGRAIDADRVVALVGTAELIVAHNAGFDRPVMERHWPIFADCNWGCSLRDVDWKAAGINQGSLEAIAARSGVFYDGHRADADCYAGIHILAQDRPNAEGTFLKELLATAGACSYLVRAIGAPFDKKDMLKSRGYRWHDGKKGLSKHWFVQVGTDHLEAEKEFLFAEIYGRERDIPIEQQSAATRYSGRV